MHARRWKKRKGGISGVGRVRSLPMLGRFAKP